MDGRVKSRGRRSLVKRHRGSRLSVPVPAARRQRVELPWGSMFVRPPGEPLANARRRAWAVDRTAGALPGTTCRDRYLDPVRGALPGDGGQARVDAADGRTGWLRWTVSRIGPDAVKRLSSPTRTWAGSTVAVGRATCPTTERLPAAARTSRPTRPYI